jgi:hypothetical protein
MTSNEQTAANTLKHLEELEQEYQRAFQTALSELTHLFARQQELVNTLAKILLYKHE